MTRTAWLLELRAGVQMRCRALRVRQRGRKKRQDRSPWTTAQRAAAVAAVFGGLALSRIGEALRVPVRSDGRCAHGTCWLLWVAV